MLRLESGISTTSEGHVRHKTAYEALYSKTTVVNDCLICDSERVGMGYARIHFKSKRILAHRLAWKLAGNPLPEGKILMHSCDVPNCVNVSHLSVGTHLDNARDKYFKGRHRHHRGEKCAAAKLTKKQVLEIRARYAKGGITYAQLAEDYPVKSFTIGEICRGSVWKDLD